MIAAQAVNPRADVSSEVLILLRKQFALEILPLITITTRGLVLLGLVSCNRLMLGRDA